MSSVLKDRETPKNPLGVIALFVFFIEAIATVSLGLAAKTPYVGHLVWFIITYPTFIALAFFLLLSLKREALYSPSDYRDDATFRDLLLRKIEVVAAKQDVAQISAVTDINDVLHTVDHLVSLDDVYTAVNVGRAYLKDKEYPKALRIFEHLAKNVAKSHPLSYRIMANRAYALNGVENFPGSDKTSRERAKSQRWAKFSCLARSCVGACMQEGWRRCVQPQMGE